MFWTTFGNALLIFVLRVVGVSLTTIRTIMVIRGLRKWAALVGFVEITIWVVAISRVLADLDTVWNVFGYSAGFAIGTLVGMWIEDKLALGYVEIAIISMTKGPEIAARVRKMGYGATQLRAEGLSGMVQMVNIVAQRKQVHDVVRHVNEIDATAFVTVEDARLVVRGYGPLARDH